jgi:hypothetical protein
VPTQIPPDAHCNHACRIAGFTIIIRAVAAKSAGCRKTKEIWMSSVEKAMATQLANIEKRTGKSIAELSEIIRNCGLTRHGQVVAHLKATLGIGHGDANTLAHVAKKAGGSGASDADALDSIYTGPKAGLRPLHDAVMKQLHDLGDFEIAPKKTYLSLRRKKQFAMVGPATNSLIEVGLNCKSLAGGARLKKLPPGRMCDYAVRIAEPTEIDDELTAWAREAYTAAG